MGFYKSEGVGLNLIKGQVQYFADLPTPLIDHVNELWHVREGSGGLLSVLNVYKYPPGLYAVNATITAWELVPLNVKVAEDSTTLINIDNWTEFFKQFLSEVYKEIKPGKFGWGKVYERNETWDCYIYALGAAYYLSIPSRTTEMWDDYKMAMVA